MQSRKLYLQTLCLTVMDRKMRTLGRKIAKSKDEGSATKETKAAKRLMMQL